MFTGKSCGRFCRRAKYITATGENRFGVFLLLSAVLTGTNRQGFDLAIGQV
jgi:hypothetical protein